MRTLRPAAVVMKMLTRLVHSPARTAIDAQKRLHDTQHWLHRIVIGERLCPFAKPVRAAPQRKLRALLAVDSDEEAIVAAVAEEASLLVQSAAPGPAQSAAPAGRLAAPAATCSTP